MARDLDKRLKDSDLEQIGRNLRSVAGVGPDAEVVTNEKGAHQSRVEYRLDLVPPLALLSVGQVLKEGAEKYGVDNWRGIAPDEHINHALVHLYAFLAGDTQDDHVTHAACRILFALDLLLSA